jgi:hypothetical protein
MRSGLKAAAFLMASGLFIALIVFLATTWVGGPSTARANFPHGAPATAGTADWVGAIAEAITALTIFVVIAQLALQRNTAKIERTRGFQERYQSDEFDSAARRMLGCMRVRDAGDCVAVIEACSNRRSAFEQVLPWPHARAKASLKDIDRTINFFEEMGTAFNQGQLSNKTVARSFADPIVDVFVQMWWWICWERGGCLAREEENGVPAETYVQYEDMVLWLMEHDNAMSNDPRLRPNDKVRALCLPAGAGENAHDPNDRLAWAASRRLSTALSTFLVNADERVAQGGTVPNQLSRITTQLETIPARQPGSDGHKPRGWDVFLVSPQLDQRCDQDWRLRRAEAKWIATSLERFENYPSLELAVAEVEEMATA